MNWPTPVGLHTSQTRLYDRISFKEHKSSLVPLLSCGLTRDEDGAQTTRKATRSPSRDSGLGSADLKTAHMSKGQTIRCEGSTKKMLYSTKIFGEIVYIPVFSDKRTPNLRKFSLKITCLHLPFIIGSCAARCYLARILESFLAVGIDAHIQRCVHLLKQRQNYIKYSVCTVVCVMCELFHEEIFIYCIKV